MNLTRVENKCIGIEWCGWETDTYRLQTQGWQISVQEELATMRMRIAIKHPGGMYGITHALDYSSLRDDIIGEMDDMSFYSGLNISLAFLGPSIEFKQRRFEVTGVDFNKFNPVDATPQIIKSEIINIEDFKIFRPLKKGSEIIIPQQNVSELLHKIHELQAPKQDEIRQRRRKEVRKMLRNAEKDMNSYELETEIVAQIATVGGL